jgi:hypothetical protein
VTAFNRDNPLLTPAMCKRCGSTLYFMGQQPDLCRSCLWDDEEAAPPMERQELTMLEEKLDEEARRDNGCEDIGDPQ